MNLTLSRTQLLGLAAQAAAAPSTSAASTLSRTQLLGLAALAAVAVSANAQSTLSQYGEILQAVGDPVPAAIPGVTPATAPRSTRRPTSTAR